MESLYKHGKRWLNPMAAVGSIVGGFIGVFTVWAFFYGIPKRELSYIVQEQKSIVYNADSDFGYKLFDPNPVRAFGHTIERPVGPAFQRDVYSTRVLLWNTGNQSIKEEHVLDPIVITIDGDNDLLDARVLQQSREIQNTMATSGHQASPESSELQEEQVLVTWKILEPEDAVLLQITYAGTEDAKILVDGVIEGKSDIAVANTGPVGRIIWSGIIVSCGLVAWVFYGIERGYRKMRAAMERGESIENIDKIGDPMSGYSGPIALSLAGMILMGCIVYALISKLQSFTVPLPI